MVAPVSRFEFQPRPARVGAACQNGYAWRAVRTIKEECIELENYRDCADVCRRIGTFLEDVYNHKRIR